MCVCVFCTVFLCVPRSETDKARGSKWEKGRERGRSVRVKKGGGGLHIREKWKRMDVCLCLCVSIRACALVITKKINEHVALNSRGKCQLSHCCVYACTVYVHIHMGCTRVCCAHAHIEMYWGWITTVCGGEGKEENTWYGCNRAFCSSRGTPNSLCRVLERMCGCFPTPRRDAGKTQRPINDSAPLVISC